MRMRDVNAIVLDARLSPGAARIVLDIARRPEGIEHEIPWSHFSALLNHPGEKAIRESIRVSIELGYIARREGGRGHNPLYAFTPAIAASLNADSMAPVGGLNGTTHGNNGDTPHRLGSPQGSLNDASDRLGSPQGSLNAPVVGSSSKDVEDEPPIVPLKRFPFSNQADHVFQTNADRLSGCRGSFQDYLQARIATERQYAYAQTVVSWANGGGGSPFKGIPPPEIPSLLANAFNELLADGEEGLKYKPGDTKNLRTKLSILMRQRNDSNERSGESHNGRNAAREGRASPPTGQSQAGRRRKSFGADDE